MYPKILPHSWSYNNSLKNYCAVGTLVPGGVICAGQILYEKGRQIATPGSLEVRPWVNVLYPRSKKYRRKFSNRLSFTNKLSLKFSLVAFNTKYFTCTLLDRSRLLLSQIEQTNKRK